MSSTAADEGGGDADPAASFPDRGPIVFAVTTATLVLATLFVAARLVSRAGVLGRTGCDDYIMVLAWLIAVFLSLSINLGTRRGLGRHDADITPRQWAGLVVSEYVFSVLYNPALMATKTSVLVFYLRLAKNTHRMLRLASWAVLGIVNVAGTILTFLNIFQCVPISAAWDVTVEVERCIPLVTEFICSAPVNIVTDLAILALPIPVLTGMRLPPRQKTILVATFALGVFVTIVDVVRIYYLQQAVDRAPLTVPSSDRNSLYGRSPGFAWNASLSFMWSAVEVNVAITCACIPTLKPLVIRVLPAMLVDPLRRHSKDATGQTTLPSTSSAAGAGAQGTPEDGGPTPASDAISIRDFLSSVPPPPRASLSAPAAPTPATPDTDTSHFDFFRLPPPPKSMLAATPRQALRYNALVTVLFFLWGFSYGLLHKLNRATGRVLDMSLPQTLGLTSVYFGGGYFVGPLVIGRWILARKGGRARRRRRSLTEMVARRGGRGREDRGRRGTDDMVFGGFKAAFITGLLIYGTGTIMFWPGAVLGAYGGFMASSFVTGCGLAVLETAANPFLVLCGAPEYAHARLLLAQAVQAVGSVLSALLADRVFFATRLARDNALIDIQWTYLAITLSSVLLALVFYYTPLPEVDDADLAAQAARLPVDPATPSLARLPLRTWTLALAVFAQWCYVAAQENTSIFFAPLLKSTLGEDPDARRGLALSAANYHLVAHAAFALSRFLASGILYLSAWHASPPDETKRSRLARYLPSPHTLLSLSVACALAAALAATLTLALPDYTPTPTPTPTPTQTNTKNNGMNPNMPVLPLLLLTVAQAPIWPLTFSLGLRGQGARTKRAAAYLVAGGSAPAFWPFVSYAVLRPRGVVGFSSGDGTGSESETRNASPAEMAVAVLVVVLALVAGAGVFPLFVGVVRGGRGLVDGNPGDGDGDGDGGRGRGSGDVEGEAKEGGTGETGAQQQQQQQQQQEAPWENQVLDTTILRD